MKKSLGELVDELAITNLKMWHLEDRRRDTTLPDSERLKAADALSPLNAKRHRLMEAIDALVPQEDAHQKVPVYEGEPVG